MIHTLLKPLTFCLLLLVLPTLHAGEKKRPITLEDLWKVKRLGKPAISPDGQWVAVDVTTYSMDDNSSHTQIWLCSTDGKTQKQLTNHKASASGPVWSPDGKSIAFVSKRDLPSPSGRGARGEGGAASQIQPPVSQAKPKNEAPPSPPAPLPEGEGRNAQIFVIRIDGGEAKQLTNLPMAPTGVKWPGDGKTLYCVVQTWPDTPDDDSYRKKEKAKKDDKVQAYVIDDALYRVWDKWIADGKRPVVFAVDADKGSHRNLFAGAKRTLPASGGSASDYDISPDGKEICFVSESAKELGMDYNTDLYTMPIASLPRKRGEEEPKNITSDNLGNDFAPVYAPDGKSIAFSRQVTKFFYADRTRIMVHRRLNGANREIAGGLDRSCSACKWDPVSDRLWFEVEDSGYHRLFHVNAELEEIRTPTTFTQGFTDAAPSASSYSKRDGLKFVFLRSDFNTPACLKKMGYGDKQPVSIDHFNDALRSEWNLGEVKNVTYKGADDEDVQMWIVYPPDFDATKKWPLLMFIHGGPHNAITTDFHYRWNAHLFASKGYVVAIPNFHGSSGFGQKFSDSITGDMATKPFLDVMKATDFMEAKPYIDKTRTTAAGASYGGYMMAWLNGHTDRYKAMVCHAGVYNWDSMMASDFVRGRERALGAFPWSDRDKIDKQSPQRFAKNFKTPTLVMHGEKDYRVPVTQGMEYYNTLRIKGVPTRFVYFPDENHWIQKPQNSRLWHREFFAWLDKHVGHGPTK